MKGFYDKIILAVGVLALAGSGAFYVTQGKGDANNPLLNQAPSGAAYAPIAAPTFSELDSAWPDPVAQDDKGLELYDVFTPPKIFWKPPQFVFEPWLPASIPVPFGLELLAVDRELYRIQVEAYFASTSGQDKDAKIQFYDYKTKSSFRGSVGDKFPEHAVEILDFSVTREVNDDGTILRVPHVAIKDLDSGKDITLTTDERLYIPDQFELRMSTVSPYRQENFSWQKTGDTHTAGDATFELLDFDFDNQTASVEKQSPDLESPETETLFAVGNLKAESTTSAAEGSPSDENSAAKSAISDSFEALFQN